MSIYISPDESKARIQVRVEETVRRRSARRKLRAQLAAARRIGLARRIEEKLRRSEQGGDSGTGQRPAAEQQ